MISSDLLITAERGSLDCILSGCVLSVFESVRHECAQLFRKLFRMKNSQSSVTDIPEFPEYSLRYVLLHIYDILFSCYNM